MRKYPEIIKKRTENQLVKSFIEQFEKVISGSNYKNKRFSFVLTGGNSPKKLYKKYGGVLFFIDEIKWFDQISSVEVLTHLGHFF